MQSSVVRQPNHTTGRYLRQTTPTTAASARHATQQSHHGQIPDSTQARPQTNPPHVRRHSRTTGRLLRQPPRRPTYPPDMQPTSHTTAPPTQSNTNPTMQPPTCEPALTRRHPGTSKPPIPTAQPPIVRANSRTTAPPSQPTSQSCLCNRPRCDSAVTRWADTGTTKSWSSPTCPPCNMAVAPQADYSGNHPADRPIRPPCNQPITRQTGIRHAAAPSQRHTAAPSHHAHDSSTASTLCSS